MTSSPWSSEACSPIRPDRRRAEIRTFTSWSGADDEAAVANVVISRRCVAGTAAAIGPRMRTRLVTLLVVSLVAAGAGCAASSDSQAEEELASQRMLFSRVSRPSYAFTWQMGCFCGRETTRPIRITVTDGSITNAVYVDDQQPVSATIRADLRTIPGVFDRIEAALDTADEVTVTYDRELRYPTSVFIDRSKGAADDESNLELSDFVSPANPR